MKNTKFLYLRRGGENFLQIFFVIEMHVFSKLCPANLSSKQSFSLILTFLVTLPEISR